MIKKVLIISGSPRKGGNSDILCDEFAKGAKEAGCLLYTSLRKIALLAEFVNLTKYIYANII